jgi:hypothetical protein
MFIQKEGFQFTAKENRLERTLTQERVPYNTIRSIVKGGYAVVTAFMQVNDYHWADCGTSFIKVGSGREVAELEVELPKSFRVSIDSKPVIITSYLLGTRVNDTIWDSLLAHINHIEASLVVVPHRYKNPTTLVASLRETEEEGSVYTDPRVIPFLAWERFETHGHMIYADVRLPINSVHCLRQAQTFVSQDSVFGHPTQSMTTIPKLQNSTDLPPTAWTTGTISDIDPADNITAKRAEFHFKYGWVVIEPDRSSRNVHLCKDGSFTDLGVVIKNNKGTSCRKPIMVFGDYHFGQHSDTATSWAWRLAREVAASDVVLHDYFDACTVNPHASPYERSLHFKGDLLTEFTCAAKHLQKAAKHTKLRLHLVPSNHNDMLSRYLLSTKVADMPESHANILQRWLHAGRDVEKMLWPHSDFASLDTSVILDQHGHKGVNGSRGSLVGFFNSGARLVFGHTHTPGMIGAVSNVGTLSNRSMRYNDGGASSWKPSVTLVDGFDKRQELAYFGKDW